MPDFYNWCWGHWYKRAKKRAMKDPTYATEEMGRSQGSFYVASGTGNDGKEYTIEQFFEHSKRFDELCPRPWWVKIHHWRDRHRLRFGMKKNDIKWFIQRGKRGYADCDLWSFDTYLSKLISKAVIDLRDTSHGYPGNFNSFEEWASVLTSIFEGFAQDKFDRDNFNEDKFNKGFELFQKYFHGLWD